MLFEGLNTAYIAYDDRHSPWNPFFFLKVDILEDHLIFE